MKNKLKTKRKRNGIVSKIKRVDRSDLLADYDFWGRLGDKAWSDTIVPEISRESYNRLVLTGMGGSALAGEIILDLARESGSTIAFETIKDYHLPNYCDQKTLVLGMSSSGNTEETLSVLSEASKRNISVVSFGSGGLLEDFSNNKWKFPFVKTTMLKVPRSSFPGMFYPVLKFLLVNRFLELDQGAVEESIQSLNIVSQKFANPNNLGDNAALELARAMLDKKPMIYSSSRTRGVGLRARQSFNENAKIHMFNGEIPELCHNEIVGWDGNKKDGRSSSVLLLRLADDPKEIKIRFDIVEKVIKRAGGMTKVAPCIGTGYLARILSMLHILDYTTYYLAILKGNDPKDTPSLDLLKEELALRLQYVSKL
ncbi:MAG: SIS domain-containing protein [Nitrososphaerales archaeon]